MIAHWLWQIDAQRANHDWEFCCSHWKYLAKHIVYVYIFPSTLSSEQWLLINAQFVHSSLVTFYCFTILFLLRCAFFILRKPVSHWLRLYSWKRSQTITTANEVEQRNGNEQKAITCIYDCTILILLQPVTLMFTASN